MIVEMGDYAWSEHIVTVFLARQITIKNVGMRARRPIKRPQLTLRHRHAQFDWSHDHLGGLFAHGDGSTGLMKVVFCNALPMVVQGFGAAMELSEQPLAVKNVEQFGLYVA
jgi:hypothetical protein